MEKEIRTPRLVSLLMRVTLPLLLAADGIVNDDRAFKTTVLIIAAQIFICLLVIFAIVSTIRG